MRQASEALFYDGETLDRACRTPVLHIRDGIAAAEDWVARVDPRIVFGRNTEGRIAQHPTDISEVLIEIARRKLDAFQSALSKNPELVTDLPTTPADLEPTQLASVKGYTLVRLPVQGSRADVSMAVDYQTAMTLIRPTDRLLTTYHPGSGPHALVIRGETVIAAIMGLVLIGNDPLMPPSAAADQHLIPTISAAGVVVNDG